MAEGRIEAAWDQTASIVAMIHNVNCAKTHQQKKPVEFHPIRAAKADQNKIQLNPKESIQVLSQYLVQRPSGQGAKRPRLKRPT